MVSHIPTLRFAKKISLGLTFLLTVAFNSIDAQNTGTYSVDGKIKNESIKGKVFLRYWSDNGPYLDSSLILDGKFSFKGKVPGTIKFARLFLVKPNEAGPSNNNNSEILLEQGHIEVQVERDFIAAKYSGSNLQKEWNELQEKLVDVKRKGFLLDEEYEKAEKEKNEVIRDRLVSFDYPALFIEKQKILEAFIKNHPSSLISAYKFDDFAGDDINLAIVEPVYNALDENLKSLAPVKAVAELINIARLTSPGKTGS